MNELTVRRWTWPQTRPDKVHRARVCVRRHMFGPKRRGKKYCESKHVEARASRTAHKAKNRMRVSENCPSKKVKHTGPCLYDRTRASAHVQLSGNICLKWNPKWHGKLAK